MSNSFAGKDEKVHELSRYEHFRKGNVAGKIVVPYTYDAETDTLTPQGTVVSERYDYSSSTTIYTATAPIGTTDAQAAWTITKYDLADASDASGKVATNAVWDDRATETYA